MKNFLSNRWLTQKHILMSDLSNESHAVHLGTFPTLLFLFGAGIAFLLFGSLLFTAIGFFLNVPITSTHYLLILLVTLPIFYLFFLKVSGKGKTMQFIGVCVAIALSVALSIIVSGKFYDLTYDGQGYHQDTIVYLSQGWNPFYEALTPESTAGLPRWKWLNSYPKGSEELSTVIYKATGHIEQSKAINFLLLFMSFGFVLSLLLRMRMFSSSVSFLGTILLVWNPVYVTQMFSFYIDGQLYLTLLSIIAVLSTLYITHKNYLLVPLAMLVSIAWSLKLTGVIFSVFIVGSFSVLFWYSEKILFFFKKIQVGFIASIIALFIIGFNPYFTNLLRFHNPFHLPTDKSELVKVNIPENYFDIDPVQRLIRSIFSESDNVKGDGSKAVLKVPFTYNDAEISTFINPDNNTGGFGPLFGAIFFVSIIAIFSVVFNKEYSNKQKHAFYFLLIMIFVSSIVIPPSSYARYVPQFWIFPVIVFLYAFSKARYFGTAIGTILLVLIIANNVLVSREYIGYNYDTTAQLKENLRQLKTLSEKEPLSVNFGVFRQNKIRFTEAGIDFIEYSELPCEKIHHRRVLINEIPESIIQICN